MRHAVPLACADQNGQIGNQMKMNRAMRPVVAVAILCWTAAASEIRLQGPGLALTFEHTGDRLVLTQIQRQDGAPLLYSDRAGNHPGAGPVGNPLAVVVRSGRYKGVYGMDSFRVTALDESDKPRLTAYLQHDQMPLFLALVISV